MNKIFKMAAISVSIIAGGIFYIFSGVAAENKVNEKLVPKQVNIHVNNNLAVANDGGIQDSIIEKNEPTSKLSDVEYGPGIKYLNEYSNKESVKQLILIKRLEGTLNCANLYLLEKSTDGKWKEMLKCSATLGKNGIGKTSEGDGCTPTGDFGVTKAFGIKDNPGSKIEYTKLTDTMYLCGDKEYYNQFIDTSLIEHKCSKASEHLIKYAPQYNYALIINYNSECIYGKGSAIFLHCSGSYGYTLGCIAVSEANMVKILQNVDDTVRVCIYNYK